MLEVKNLSHPLLSDVSCQFLPGKVYGLIGPNGAGKSTFLKCLAQIWPSTGRLFLDCADLRSLSRPELASQISLVMQSPQLGFPYLVEDAISMGFPPKSPADCQWALASMGLIPYQKELCTRLSGGLVQRVAIARSLARKPRILLLDEATSNLDIAYEMRLWNLLRSLKDTYVIICCHDIQRAAKFCDELLLFSNGELILKTDSSSMLASNQLVSTFQIDKEILYML